MSYVKNTDNILSDDTKISSTFIKKIIDKIKIHINDEVIKEFNNSLEPLYTDIMYKIYPYYIIFLVLFVVNIMLLILILVLIRK